MDIASYGNGSNFKPGGLNVIHEEDQASRWKNPEPKTLLQVRTRSRGGANRSVRMGNKVSQNRSVAVGIASSQSNS